MIKLIMFFIMIGQANAWEVVNSNYEVNTLNNRGYQKEMFGNGYTRQESNRRCVARVICRPNGYSQSCTTVEDCN